MPTFVRAFGAKPSYVGVEITWEVLSDHEVSGFDLYRRLARETEFAVVNANGLMSTDLRSYVDNETEPASAYEYKLTIILGDGSEVVSPPVTVTTVTLVAHTVPESSESVQPDDNHFVRPSESNAYLAEHL